MQLHTPKNRAQAWAGVKDDEPNWTQKAGARLSVLKLRLNSSFFPPWQGKHIAKYQKVLETDFKIIKKTQDSFALQLTSTWSIIKHTKMSYPPRVFHNFLIWLSVIWWIGVWIVAQFCEHGCNHWHVLQNISRYLPNPLWQCFHIDRLDYLVSRSFNSVEEERKVIFCIPTTTCFFTSIKTFRFLKATGLRLQVCIAN